MLKLVSSARVWRAVVLAAAFGGALAMGANAAERRAIVTDDTDYFGRDLGTLKNVDLDQCRQDCVDDKACKAFTYNTRRAGASRRRRSAISRAFPGAISGKIVEASAADPNLADTRRAELSYLDQSYRDEANRFIGTL